MADIAKAITFTGSSPDGFAEAAQVAGTEASKTLRGVSGAEAMLDELRRLRMATSRPSR